MQTFILSLILILASVAGLAVGVIFKRAPLRGSCGGVACGDGISCGCQRAEQVERAS
jgi:hypothetical protein